MCNQLIDATLMIMIINYIKTFVNGENLLGPKRNQADHSNKHTDSLSFQATFFHFGVVK